MNKDRFRFRFWDIFNAVMINSHDEHNGINSCFFAEFEKSQDGDNNPVLMQCTGLKDKNGVLIFEGDAWAIKKECVDGYGEATHGQYYQEKHIVRWSKNKAAFVIGFYIGDHLDETFSLDEYVSEDGVLDFVITNNIHENPELLEQ